MTYHELLQNFVKFKQRNRKLWFFFLIWSFIGLILVIFGRFLINGSATRFESYYVTVKTIVFLFIFEEINISQILLFL